MDDDYNPWDDEDEKPESALKAGGQLIILAVLFAAVAIGIMLIVK